MKQTSSACSIVPAGLPLSLTLASGSPTNLVFYYSPLDFVVSPQNRLIYSILFGIMGTAVVQGYGNYRGVLAFLSDNIYAKLFNKIGKIELAI